MYNIEFVLEALSLYNQNKSFKKTSKLLKVKYNSKISRQTIMNWNKWMINDIDKICKKRMTIDYCNNIILSKQKKFNIEIINDIHKLISINPFITRNNVIDVIFKKFNIKLSQSSISSIFKKLNLTRKKPRNYIVKSIDFLDKLIAKRNEFNIQISKIDINKIISIDESGFNSLNNINKGLSEKGKRINVPISDKKIKNKSLISAVTLNGIIHYEIHETGVNGEIFKDYIQNIINKLKTTDYYFIFDNVPFHHNKEMLKLIKDSGHHYIFTPPYSPNNNPIETIFGIIKSNFKKEYKEKDDKNKNICIKNLINNAVNKVNKEYDYDKLLKIFNHSLKYNYKDLEKELRDRIIIKVNNK
jgi:transposase